MYWHVITYTDVFMYFIKALYLTYIFDKWPWKVVMSGALTNDAGSWPFEGPFRKRETTMARHAKLTNTKLYFPLYFRYKLKYFPFFFRDETKITSVQFFELFVLNKKWKK